MDFQVRRFGGLSLISTGLWKQCELQSASRRWMRKYRRQADERLGIATSPPQPWLASALRLIRLTNLSAARR